jgi:hypothetical protein
MRHSDLLVSALDLLMLFLVLMFLALMAIRYDANKGLGEESYVRMYSFYENDKDLSADERALRFQAVTLDKVSVKLYRFDEGKRTLMGTFKTAHELFSSKKLDITLPCVLHEKEQSAAFAEIIRGLIKSKIPMGIAQVSRQERQ